MVATKLTDLRSVTMQTYLYQLHKITSNVKLLITAVSVDSFKNRLDKFWANEEARFDYKANLSGSGFARCF